jgi:hypothetical protein
MVDVKYFLLFVLAAVFMFVPLHAQQDELLLSGKTWKLSPQADAQATGEQISSPGFTADSWLNAQVPGTVFCSYVLAGKEKDPNYGDNIYQVDLKKYDRNFWYRTDFTVPAGFKGTRIWLNLDAVNRDADVFVNGLKLGSMHGFVQRGRFDVTNLVHMDANNSLAVLDYFPVNTACLLRYCCQGFNGYCQRKAAL